MSSDLPHHYDPLEDERVPEPADPAAVEGDIVESGTILGREPVLIYAAVQAIITVAVTFGLQLTAEQIGAVLVLTTAILSLIVRSKVTPA